MSARLHAVLIDALGTLVRLEPPAPRLREELSRATGGEVPLEAAEAAFAAEVGYYLEHHLEARDPESLAGLRDRCGAVLMRELSARVPALGPLDPASARDALLASLRFHAYPDAGPCLDELRRRGLRVVAVSNWDVSLPDVLHGAGLGDEVDAVVPSSLVGAAKPDPRLFRAGLDAAGTDASGAVHVGDSLENDVAGAAAAGIEAVLLDRSPGEVGAGPTTAPSHPRSGAATPLAVIRTLAELPAVLEGAASVT